MQLELATWSDVERYLARRRDIIVPIGSTEQHGPGGLLGTDAITAEAIATRVGERLDVFVTPAIRFGMAQHHLAFPGTISLRPSTLMAVIRDVVQSLACHGFERIFFINGHGGNVEVAATAFSEIYAETSFSRPPVARSLRCTLRNWWEGRETAGLINTLYGSADGAHATASEISVTQFCYPDTIRHQNMTPVVATEFVDGIYDAYDLRGRYPDGRIGSNPCLSSPEHGRSIIEAAVRDLAAEFQFFSMPNAE